VPERTGVNNVTLFDNDLYILIIAFYINSLLFKARDTVYASILYWSKARH
jgi:hypothetical protein